MARKKTVAKWLFGSPLQIVGALTFVGGVAYYMGGGVIEQGAIVVEGFPTVEWRIRLPFWTDKLIVETRSAGAAFWSLAGTTGDIEDARRMAGAQP